MTKIKLIALMLAAFGLSISANAAPITGDISLSNVGSYTVLGCDATPIASECVTGYDFSQDGVGGVFVANASGDLGGTLLENPFTIIGKFGDITDFSFDNPNELPVQPLWSIGGFSFDLLSVSAPQYTHSGGSSTVSQSGFGNLYGNGFDVTEYNWVMSSTNPGSGTFSWSATQTRVPEPGTLALLGLGLAGLGFSRRKAA